MQRVRGREHLSAPARQERVQGVRGPGPLTAPARQEADRSRCKECGGGSICDHQRIRSDCRECAGPSICEHKCRRSLCKECGWRGPVRAPAREEQVQDVPRGRG